MTNEDAQRSMQKKGQVMSGNIDHSTEACLKLGQSQ